ncbi:MAG: hypothetical protein N3E45_17135 [Oscillatoriaceae bacterium SKW80]|nr:hypothetical protein [Oscillatoriaceae bacterium SKW80]HIK27960.1 hypothetical protein [Oscillatoriaceae cyanobacterium M7585_C2015_266]
MWRYLGRFQLKDKWQILPARNFEIFRVKHQPISNPANKYLKGVIAGAILEGEPINLISPQRLSYREESEIFTFYFPEGIGEKRLLFKRLDSTPDLKWEVLVEYYEPSSSVNEDFANYIINRFRDLMPLFTNVSTSLATIKYNLIPVSTTVAVVNNTPVLLIAANTLRRGLTIENPTNKEMILGFQISNNQLQQRWLEIPPRSFFEMPTGADGSCYTGAIFVLPGISGSLTVVEFSQGASL